MAITQTSHKGESITDHQLDERDARALATPMTVIDDAGFVAGAAGMYEVTSASGKCYVVDLDGDVPRCTCKDHQYRQTRCKHIRRVCFEIGAVAIPGWADVDIDDQLGEFVTTGEPRIAMPDGGIRSAAPTATDGRPATEVERVDGGWLVWAVDGDARTLAGFADVDDWDAIRSEVARRGLDVGAIHHLDEVALEEVA